MIVLGVETSCDDTAAAVLEDGRSVRANLVSSQDAVHAPFGGIVPEMASRQHIQAIRPMVDRALEQAGVGAGDLDGLAVTHGPGLTGSLLVGLSFVKGWSFRSGIPYVGVNHLEAHVLSIFLEKEVELPVPGAGGLRRAYAALRRPRVGSGAYEHLGGTLDDAAGEAYDKVAKMMGLGFPGGRVIDGPGQAGEPPGRGLSARASAHPLRLQLQRPEDVRVALSHAQARGPLARRDGGHRGELSGSGGGHADRADAPGGGGVRHRERRPGRGGRRQQPSAREAGGEGRRGRGGAPLPVAASSARTTAPWWRWWGATCWSRAAAAIPV